MHTCIQLKIQIMKVFLSNISFQNERRQQRRDVTTTASDYCNRWDCPSREWLCGRTVCRACCYQTPLKDSTAAGRSKPSQHCRYTGTMPYATTLWQHRGSWFPTSFWQIFYQMTMLFWQWTCQTTLGSWWPPHPENSRPRYANCCGTVIVKSGNLLHSMQYCEVGRPAKSTEWANCSTTALGRMLGNDQRGEICRNAKQFHRDHT